MNFVAGARHLNLISFFNKFSLKLYQANFLFQQNVLFLQHKFCSVKKHCNDQDSFDECQ